MPGIKELDPRQQKLLENYLDPNSKTFGNMLQSALDAGYAQEYAESITSLNPNWLSENIGRLKMLKKAERNLDNFLDDDSDKKLQQDTTKFVAKTIGKSVYSTKEEIKHSGAVGFNLLDLHNQLTERPKQTA